MRQVSIIIYSYLLTIKMKGTLALSKSESPVSFKETRRDEIKFTFCLTGYTNTLTEQFFTFTL